MNRCGNPPFWEKVRTLGKPLYQISIVTWNPTRALSDRSSSRSRATIGIWSSARLEREIGKEQHSGVRYKKHKSQPICFTGKTCFWFDTNNFLWGPVGVSFL